MTAPARTTKTYIAVVGVRSPPRYKHLAGLLGHSIVDLDGELLTGRDWTNQSIRGTGGTSCQPARNEASSVSEIGTDRRRAEFGGTAHAVVRKGTPAWWALRPSRRARKIPASQDRGIANWPMPRRPRLIVGGERDMDFLDRVLSSKSRNIRRAGPCLSGGSWAKDPMWRYHLDAFAIDREVPKLAASIVINTSSRGHSAWCQCLFRVRPGLSPSPQSTGIDMSFLPSQFGMGGQLIPVLV